MNAFNNVNLAAACLLTSTKCARELGISETRWVYPLGGAGTQDAENCTTDGIISLRNSSSLMRWACSLGTSELLFKPLHFTVARCRSTNFRVDQGRYRCVWFLFVGYSLRVPELLHEADLQEIQLLPYRSQNCMSSPWTLGDSIHKAHYTSRRINVLRWRGKQLFVARKLEIQTLFDQRHGLTQHLLVPDCNGATN